jgi:high affinity Mn2+ porin
MPRSRFLPLSLRPAALLLLAATASAAKPNPADTSPWSLHAQSTVVEQWHDSLTSPYSGLNSLSGRHEDKHTATLTLFLGHTLWTGGELYYNPEMSQGTGLSDSVGMAGFPNGEATRAGAKVAQYNTARLFLRQLCAARFGERLLVLFRSDRALLAQALGLGFGACARQGCGMVG